MLEELQHWYQSQCNGEWEHSYGVSIDTLDNPGWKLKIDLKETGLQEKPFPRIDDSDHESSWICCWVEGETFHATCGPQMLSTAIRYFMSWARA
jgi:hypothetical protein